MCEFPYCPRCNSPVFLWCSRKSSLHVLRLFSSLFFPPQSLFRILLVVSIFMCCQFLTPIAQALKRPPVSVSCLPFEGDVPFTFWVLANVALVLFQQPCFFVFIVRCFCPPKTVVPKVTVFSVGGRKQKHIFTACPGKSDTKSPSQNPVDIAVVHYSVVVAYGIGWSVCRLFRNLPCSQTVCDTCTQIMGFADLTPPFYQAGCYQFLASW